MRPIVDRRGVGPLRAGRDASDARRGTGVYFDPRKVERVTLSEWDSVIVMAEA